MKQIGGFTVKSAVTKPLFSLKHQPTLAVKITAAIMETDISFSEVQNTTQKPRVVECINLETGEEGMLIASAVVESSLMRNYADGSYVGKCFLFQAGTIKEGKKYRTVQVYEIEEPAADPQPTGAAPIHSPSKRR